MARHATCAVQLWSQQGVEARDAAPSTGRTARVEVESPGGAEVKTCDRIHLKDVINATCIQTVHGEAISVIFEADVDLGTPISSTADSSPAGSAPSNSTAPADRQGTDESEHMHSDSEPETMVCGWDQGEELLVVLPLHDSTGAGLNVKQVGEFILIDPVCPFHPAVDGHMGG